MIITVDTGGTKTLVASRSAQGFGHTRYRFPTPKKTDDYIKVLSSTISEHYDLTKVQAISIAVPGLVKDEHVVFCPNIDPSWKDFALVATLRSRLSTKAPIFLQNDSNMAGLGETHALPHKPQRCVYITISTGIGLSMTQNGVLAPGLQLTEGAHMMLEYDGALRQWEHFASGRAIYETYGKYARDIKDRAVWEQIVDKLSRGFLVFVPLLEPDTIIIGGSIGTYFERYHTILDTVLDQKLVSYLPRPKIIQAKHPEEAVIYGCYHYASQQLAR